jgi:phosphatidylglycerophosphate synthase
MQTPFDRFTTPQEEARLRSIVDRWLPQWVTPNGITYFRLACIIVVLVLMAIGTWAAALVLFIFAMLLDAIDGILARARNQVTNHGKLLDPIVDKAAILLPFWLWRFLVGGTAAATVGLVAAGIILTVIECALLAIRLPTIVSPTSSVEVPKSNDMGRAKVWVEGFMVGITLCGPREPIAHAIALAFAIVAITLACGSWYGHRTHRRTTR